MDKVTRISLLIITMAVILLVIGGIMGCNDTNSFIIIEGSTDLLSEPDTKDTPGNMVIATLQKGEKGKIIHTRYSKSFMFYKIKLDDGRSGYVMFGDKFKVGEDQK